MQKTAIIIGAGPAGLTAAYELLTRTDIIPVIIEKSVDIGGISKTVNYKGNRIDIGGHRFFSKSDRVMNWWMKMMPVQPEEKKAFTVTYQRHSRTVKAEECLSHGAASHDTDKVMLVRHRLSRIYFLRKFFTYPIQLSLDTLKKLGIGRTTKTLLSYLKARLFPRKPERNLEDFFVNRFGNTLYRMFFKDYTEKVWGVPCTKISAEWGAQRIKGISIGKAIAHAARSLAPRKRHPDNDIGQKDTETSLIEKFLYPKFGPGQLWEEVARQVKEMGGIIDMHRDVRQICTTGDRITAIEAVESLSGEVIRYEGDYFFSTMPVQELIAGMGQSVPANVQEIAAGLQYRDFITVGVLLKDQEILPDTWIYIQEKDVKVGRLQIFNNWSPHMVKDESTVWLGMEYFCNTTDAFWQLPDDEIQRLAIAELEKMGLIRLENVLDSTVLRMEKTYPAYFGTYTRFEELRSFTDQLANLFLVGRNGMHKYNNSDHSMLTAMVSVDNIIAGVISKANIWSINTEQEYHEEKVVANSPLETVASTNPKQTSPLLRHSRTAPVLLTFKDYILKDKWNKRYLWIAAGAILIQFLIFKHFYPQAGFINGDSYVYLQTAYWNYDINTYPTGYSKFLRVFSTFTTSDTALVAFQYLMMQASGLFFLFSFFFFYRPGNTIQIILLAFVLFNPIFLYLSNYILSDAIFIPLSITWFTLLLWIMYRPRPWLIVTQILVLSFAFTVRYNALFYPLVGAIAILMTRQRPLAKIASTAGSMLLIGLFILFTSNKYNELAGKREFSPFTGWQIANNAMYAYRYVDSLNLKPVPQKFQNLDRLVRTYFDTTRDLRKNPQEMLVASTVYMWAPNSPLQKYMNLQFKKDSSSGPLKKWATVAPLYADYGNWLIRAYPEYFLKHYLWPNAMKYYAPPVEFLDTYNMGADSVSQLAKLWFHYKTVKVRTLFKDFNVSALDFYPVLVGISNVVFLLSFLFYIVLNGIRRHTVFSGILYLAASLWVLNFAFSVFASPIALRFQIFPVLIFLSVALLLLEHIWKAAFPKQNRMK
jgi:protoporphyrinogen oxidase